MRTTNRGQALIVAVIIFLAMTMIIVLGAAAPIVKQVKSSQDAYYSRESYFLAEAGVEDVVYRLKNGISVSNSETLILGDHTVETTVADSAGGKVITAEGDRDGYVRSVETTLQTGDGAAFSFALQTGNGGFDIAGGSTINGNVYSNGKISGNSGTITGSATSANSAPLSATFSNTCPTTPTDQVTFANASAAQDFSQSFSVGATGNLSKVRFYVRRTSSSPSGTFTVRVSSDNGGKPSTNTIDSATVSISSIPTSFNGVWMEVLFSNNVQLLADTTYWVVFDSSSNNASRYYTMGASSAQASYEGKTGRFGDTTWNVTSPSGLDGCIEVYTGGITSEIYGEDGSWDLSVNGDSWANQVNKTNTTGTIYCQTGTGNAGGKTCDTSRSDPPQQPFAITEADVAGWKEAASDFSGGWTYPGNLTIGYQGTTTTTLRRVDGGLTINGGGIADMEAIEVNGNVSIAGGATLKAGPMKVNGNLTVGSTGLIVKGTIWVTGTITVSSGATLRLDSSYGTNSGMVIADGRVTVNGGGSFEGSGQAGSYPLLISMSDCPYDDACGSSPAITISGGAGAVVLVAPKGNLSMNGGTSARAMTAYRITITGGGSITYDSGLADLTLSSGPSGGWNITSWKEVQ